MKLDHLNLPIKGQYPLPQDWLKLFAGFAPVGIAIKDDRNGLLDDIGLPLL